jgi:para-nitrobenzyl esterase
MRLRMRRKQGIASMAVVLLMAVSAAAVYLIPSSTAAAAPTPAVAPACSAGTTVRTASGPVCGIVAGNDTEWLGIPYAAPPVGDLRWQSPQPPASWTSVLQATEFGASCVQPSGSTLIGSENCLFVNVTRPADGTAGLPVLVHIHSGGFTVGSGNGDYTLLANTGHEVVVSMNYRLGILGFLAGAVFGPHSGDYGLQDQQAALRWVQQNIAQFGGDPSNVTIEGESAGGSSVCDAIASPTAKGLFERAISVSGEYDTMSGYPASSLEAQDCKSALPTQAEADSAGLSYAAAAGCADAATDAACLRALPVATAFSIAGSVGYQLGGQGTIGPTINGTTLTQTLRQALKTGQVNRVPVIAGTDRDEDLMGNATTAASYTRLVESQYGPIASQVLAKYPLSHFGSPAIAFRTVAADSNTVCPALETDADLARWMPVYGYEIDDNDPVPYTPSNSAGAAPGAAHVAAWYLSPMSGLDADQQALQDNEVADVTQFAATGSPSAAGTPPWPSYGRSGEVMSLQPAGDSELITAAQLGAQHNCAFWDSAVSRFTQPYPDLAAAFNNIAITSEPDPAPANLNGGFDAEGDTYSQQALDDATPVTGATLSNAAAPGSHVSYDGVTFTMPRVPADTLDNAGSNGATIRLSGSGSAIAFLGAEAGGVQGTVIVSYSDGSASTAELGFPNWTVPAGDLNLFGAVPVIQTGHRDTPSGPANYGLNFDLYFNTIPITPGKTVASITLPYNGKIHIFAIAIKH